MKFIVDVVDESEDSVPAALNCDYVIVTNTLFKYLYV